MRSFLGALLLFSTVAALDAASILVPNASFESPSTDFAGPDIAAWQKAAQPFWYTDTNFAWAQLMGQFLNTSNGSPDHIHNVQGSQGAYLFTLPDVALFQDYNPISGTNAAPSTIPEEFPAV